MTTQSSTLVWRILWIEEPGAADHEVAESDMTEQLTYNSSVNIFTFLHFFPEDTNFYLV